MSAWENHHLEYSPDPLSVTNPSYVDITRYARAESGPPIRIQTGIPVMGSSAQYATLWASVDNTDHRFLFGNTLSPLVNWKPARRIRCYETVGCRRFDLFSGFLQPPETDDHAEQGADQYMTVTAVDRLGWLGTARPMVSTLGEHVIYNGGSGLVAYWPLLESGGAPFNPGPTTPQQPLYLVDVAQSGIAVTLAAKTSSVASVGGGPAIPGDDKATLRLSPTVTGGVYAFYPEVIGDLSPTVTLTSGNTLTFSLWVYPEDPAPGADIVVAGIASVHGANADGFQLQRFGGVWTAQFFLGSSFPTVTFPGLAFGAWNYVSMRMSLPSGLCELWFNGVTSGYTTTIGSPPASSSAIDRIYAGAPLQGNLGHSQIYNGTGYTAATHLAQYRQGFTGLYGQTTGQRIRTLAQYAGIGAGELSYVDDGIAAMSRATLAGQTPLAEMRVAETTEQGRLRTNGAGLIVFDPRTRRYNG